SAVLGTAWTITTYFVVPVLVVERVGPFQAISRSLSILRQAWGEALVGHAGIGLFTFLLALPWIALLALGFYVALGVGVVVGWVLGGFGAVYFLIWMAVSAALHGIHVGALYQYAAHGQVPSGFDAQTLTTAFGPK